MNAINQCGSANLLCRNSLASDIRWVNAKDKDARTKEQVIYMLNRLAKVFEIGGGASTTPMWKINQDAMFGIPHFPIVHEGKLYIIPFTYGGKPDANYIPTQGVYANAALGISGTFELKDTPVLKNDTNNFGIVPMLERYASQIAEAELSLQIANVNSRLVALMSAGSDNDAKAATEVLRSVERGDLMAMVSRNFLQSMNVQPYSQGTSAITDLIELIQYLKASEFNELGLDANYNMKRESLNSTEAQMNTDALLPLIEDMYAQRKEFFDKLNADERYSGLMDLGPITLDWGSAWKINREEIELTLETMENMASGSEPEGETDSEPSSETEEVTEEVTEVEEEEPSGDEEEEEKKEEEDEE
jgi:hypothetical protein